MTATRAGNLVGLALGGACAAVALRGLPAAALAGTLPPAVWPVLVPYVGLALAALVLALAAARARA